MVDSWHTIWLPWALLWVIPNQRLFLYVAPTSCLQQKEYWGHFFYYSILTNIYIWCLEIVGHWCSGNNIHILNLIEFQIFTMISGSFYFIYIYIHSICIYIYVQIHTSISTLFSLASWPFFGCWLTTHSMAVSEYFLYSTHLCSVTITV